MERSYISLKYNGAIPDAIAESQKQKKLLIVYVSGQDDTSNRLEKDVWTNSQVVDVVSKFCVLLHIHDGTSDAAHFSAIYPQKSFPSITVVGYNGAQLWQMEGFIEAEKLATNLEKSWLSLNIQAATATYIAGALYSKSQDISQASTSATSSSSSRSSLNTPPQVTESCEIEEIKTINQVIEHDHDPEMETQTHAENEAKSSEANEESKPKIEEKPSGITLSIRLPDRSTLFEKFAPYDTLEDVKNFVSSKVNNLKDYNLALPYPRKVFLDEDLNKSLLELDLLNRQALITVPKGVSLKRTIETQSDASNGGYFTYVGRLFSYINPFSYFPRANTTNQGDKASSVTKIGSNVHTLHHDDDQSDDRNQYWNGNSTQYGGEGPR